METLDNKRTKIQELGLEKIKNYFELGNNANLENLDKDLLRNLFNMAKLGMQFEKEMNLSKRATEMNYLRIGKLISENRDELKKYIKKSLPQYL
jgi:hypothetical protein